MKTPIEFLKWNVISNEVNDVIEDVNNDTIHVLPVIVDKEEIESIECIQQSGSNILPINKIIFKNGTFIYVAWNWATICNKMSIN